MGNAIAEAAFVEQSELAADVAGGGTFVAAYHDGPDATAGLATRQTGAI